MWGTFAPTSRKLDAQPTGSWSAVFARSLAFASNASMYASVPTGGGQPGRLGVHRTEVVMVTQTRWTALSVAHGTALDAWLRRKGVDEKQRTAALHEWENEGGTEEMPVRSGLAGVRAEPDC